jgi:hypothetical protein
MQTAMPRLRRHALHAAALLAALVAVSAARASVQVGIDDPRATTFTDPRFQALGVRYARLVVPWDAIGDPAPVDAWMEQARSAGIEPLVAFEHSAGDSCPGSPCTLPTLDRYGQAFDAFRARYPDVRLYTPWNEANHQSQPTAAAPQRAADYYNLMRARCPDCTVVAADVLGSADAPSWLGDFRRYAQGDPQLWGLHNYPDVNRLTDSGTRAVLDAVPGAVWLTETGGVVSFVRTDGSIAFPYDEQRAASALTYLFHYLVPTYSTRIPRVYVHEWRTSPTSDFDSGLIAPDGTARPGLGVFKAALPAPAVDPLAPDAPPSSPGTTGSGHPLGLPLGTPAARLHLVRVRAGRSLRATFTCEPGPGACAARIRLMTLDALRRRRGRRPMRVTLAATGLRVPAGRTGSARLVVGARARRLALRHARRSIAVILTTGPADGGFPRHDLTRTSIELR